MENEQTISLEHLDDKCSQLVTHMLVLEARSEIITEVLAQVFPLLDKQILAIALKNAMENCTARVKKSGIPEAAVEYKERAITDCIAHLGCYAKPELPPTH